LVFNDLFFRFRSLFRRKTVESEADTELRFHFDQQVEKYLKAGQPREEAIRRARIDFGGHEQLKEEIRDARGVNLIETLFQDIRYGLRILGRTPVVSSVAVLSLALGIGANTAIFSLIDTVMLRLLPVEKPEELVQLLRANFSGTGEGNPSFTNPLWEQVRDHQDVFSGAFAWGNSNSPFDLSQGGAVHPAAGIFASGNYFNTLGVRPAAGRLISPSDDARGCPAVAVLSYGFWRNHFGGAQEAIGSTLSLNNHPFQIIGVSSPGFYGVEVGNRFDVAVPICSADVFDGKDSRLDHRSWWWLSVMGRVKTGVSPGQLKARLGVLSPPIFSGALPKDWDDKGKARFLKLTLIASPAGTGISYLRRRFGQPLHILMGVVGLVLLIACANIASLMLARATARHRELAVRKALGASRVRLIRQLLTECVLLSTMGALLGFLFANWGAALLVGYLSTAKNQVFLDLSVDTRVLGFTAAIAVLTGILFGVLPAFRSTGVSLTSAMKGAQALDTERRLRFRPAKWIVAAQVALALVLLVASGLFLRSFVKLSTLDIGFDRSNVLIVHADLHTAKVPPDRWLETYQQIEDRLSSLPGIVSAGRSVMTPISGFEWNQFVHTDSPNSPKGDDALVYFNFISPGYFQTMRTPLLAGRGFNDHDTKTATKVAIVNQVMAHKFFPNADPLGKYFTTDADPGKAAPQFQIVGLARDSKYESLREETFATAFFPITQVSEGDSEENFILRTATKPVSLASAVQEAIAGINKAIPLEFHTLAEQVDDSLVQERLLATLSTFFGALALLLAIIGLYGALSYLVAQRQREFGIRMALGAPRDSILRLVMRDVVIVLGVGLMAGAGISLAAVGLLQKLLFGLAARDPVTLLASAGVLSAVAFFAGYLPARRATRLDPLVALRYE
jgi:putative ABC transport system permease protein